VPPQVRILATKIAAAEKTGGVLCSCRNDGRLLETDHLDDQFAALAWLRKTEFRSTESPRRGGKLVWRHRNGAGSRTRRILCGIDSAGGAQSWAQAPELQSLMTRAVRNAKAPIFFFSGR